jgi:hypothetical protein
MKKGRCCEFKPGGDVRTAFKVLGWKTRGDRREMMAAKLVPTAKVVGWSWKDWSHA